MASMRYDKKYKELLTFTILHCALAPVDLRICIRVTSLSLGYRQVSNIRRTLVGNKIVDNEDVVGASPVGAAPTISSLST